MIREEVDGTARRTLTRTAQLLSALRLDGPLLVGLALIALYGQIVLYSSSGGDWGAVARGTTRLAIGAALMLVCAQLKPGFLRRISPWLYILGFVLLVIVDLVGYIGKGAQRWLDLGFVRFQPSEIMKLAEASSLPAAVKVWLCLELLGTSAAFPVAQHDAILGIPVAG